MRARKPADPIELRVYPGANGSFVLYEDEGDNYNYEKGAHATIRFDWDDASEEADDWRAPGDISRDARNREHFISFMPATNHGAGSELSNSPIKL